MENARLLNRDGARALEQQTATPPRYCRSSIASPGDPSPRCFDAMLEKGAAACCGGSFGELRSYDGRAVFVWPQRRACRPPMFSTTRGATEAFNGPGHRFPGAHPGR